MRLIFLITLFLVSCSKKEDILSARKMEGVLWEYVQADVYTSEFLMKDSSVNADRFHMILLKGIFERNHISKETFYRSYDYYMKNPDLLNPVLDSIINQQNRSRFNITKIKKTGNE